jgi:hypothetical protein
MKPMLNSTKGKILRYSATAICVGVPFSATLTQFPIWVEKSSDATMSGLFLVFAFISCLPFTNQIREYFKSPAVWVVWTLMFTIFTLLRNIIDEMLVVCFFGMISNIIGVPIYRYGKKLEEKIDNEDNSKENEE